MVGKQITEKTAFKVKEGFHTELHVCHKKKKKGFKVAFGL